MSIELEIYSAGAAVTQADLPDPDRWVRHDGHWERAGKGWVLSVFDSAPCHEPDLDPEVVAALPGLHLHTSLGLSPSGAPKSGHTLLAKTAQRIARATHGVIVDPQAGTLQTPRGLKRFVPDKLGRGARVEVLDLSWWYLQPRIRTHAGAQALVDLLGRHTPELLPTTYGPTSPARHRLSEVGTDHLVHHLATDEGAYGLFTLVWNPQRPGVDLALSEDGPACWQRVGRARRFRANRLSLKVERAVLARPGWRLALQRLFRGLSGVLQPFYGELRTLRGWQKVGRSWHVDAETEQHPVSSWWWMGVPPELPHAFVVGAPYLDLWPDLAPHEGLAFAGLGNWTGPAPAAAPPADIAASCMGRWVDAPGGGRTMAYPEVLPAVFPFPGA